MKRICKYCNIEFNEPNGRIFSNHVRWCKKNPNRNNTKSISDAKIKSDEKRLGKIKSFEVTCNKCQIEFHVSEREKQFPRKEKYFCSRSCSNSHIVTEEHRIKTSMSVKQAWKDGVYDNIDYGTFGNQRKFWSSKAERLIIDHFQTFFPEDDWTFGGGIKQDGIRLSRDMFSHKLKICFEYDGVWHFEDIMGQLEKKQHKDKLLEKWCHENGYRLVRIDEEYFEKNNALHLTLLEILIYNYTDPVIKYGDRYAKFPKGI